MWRLTTTALVGILRPWVRRNPENPCGEVLYSQQVYEGDAPPNSKSCGPGLPSTHRAPCPAHPSHHGVDQKASFDNVPMDVTIACGDLNHIPAMPEDCAGVDLSFTQTVSRRVAAHTG